MLNCSSSSWSFSAWLLTVFPEFFYLRDQFGTRMNTIFKFYFQAWIFWGIAAAAGSAILFRQLRGWRSTAFQVLWIVTILAGYGLPGGDAVE